MDKKNYLFKSLINAVGAFVYITCVAWLMFNSHGFIDQSNSFLVPVFMLLLFVISAAITATLVLGKPMSLYLGGLKKEGFILLFCTLGWLIIFLLGTAAILISQKQLDVLLLPFKMQRRDALLRERQGPKGQGKNA